MKYSALVVVVFLLFTVIAKSNLAYAATGGQLIGGEFALVDQTGTAVTNNDYLGKYSLVFFGFTHCPNVCPLGLHRMVAALSKIEHFETKIIPIFISVDAQRDTPERLTKYLGAFHQSIVGLTGTEAQLEQAATNYRAYFNKSVDKDSGDYTYDHSAIIYLMDKQGNYVTHFGSNMDITEMSNIIAAHLAEK